MMLNISKRIVDPQTFIRRNIDCEHYFVIILLIPAGNSQKASLKTRGNTRVSMQIAGKAHSNNAVLTSLELVAIVPFH